MHPSKEPAEQVGLKFPNLHMSCESHVPETMPLKSAKLQPRLGHSLLPLCNPTILPQLCDQGIHHLGRFASLSERRDRTPSRQISTRQDPGVRLHHGEISNPSEGGTVDEVLSLPKPRVLVDEHSLE